MRLAHLHRARRLSILALEHAFMLQAAQVQLIISHICRCVGINTESVFISSFLFSSVAISDQRA
uniref:Uncharacterized protein n=1 Tax=Physcomitrium patens TaxID=3218 RepID=A0A2K1IV97_PHYPA|nr:hypothetical protein PHYPA_025147 [Physcomitrium patens]